MPYADNQGVRIHYEVDGGGPPLILHHGFTQSVADWQEYGYVEALSPNFRVVRLDARGHGGSDKPHDPGAYTLDKRAGDVVAVMDALAIETAHFWGYSMGGWIGFGMAQYAAERVDRLVIGGQHPFAQQMGIVRGMARAGIEGGPDAFLEAFERATGSAPHGEVAERLRRGDYEAFFAQAAHDRPNLESMLPTIALPCCLYAGNADPFFAAVWLASRIIPGARFFSLPGFGHVQAFTRREIVLPLVTAFLQR
jgi:pimeloyl-ACP methyl ester carboxylesterase